MRTPPSCPPPTPRLSGRALLFGCSRHSPTQRSQDWAQGQLTSLSHLPFIDLNRCSFFPLPHSQTSGLEKVGGGGGEGKRKRKEKKLSPYVTFFLRQGKKKGCTSGGDLCCQTALSELAAIKKFWWRPRRGCFSLSSTPGSFCLYALIWG